MAKRIYGKLEVRGKLGLPLETVNTVPVVDVNGEISSSIVTPTELERLSGVTSDIQAQIDAKIDVSEKGVADGVATLDNGGKIPVNQLPNAVMTYEGTWDASTNTPTLADGVGDAGQVYRVNGAGTVDFGSGNISFESGDYVIYSGTVWEKADGTDAVVSVNGLQGVVVLDSDDITEGTTNLYFTDERAQDAVGTILTDSAQIDFTYDDVANTITANVINNSIDGTKVRLAYDEYLRGRNSTNTVDLNILKIGLDDLVEFGTSIIPTNSSVTLGSFATFWDTAYINKIQDSNLIDVISFTNRRLVDQFGNTAIDFQNNASSLLFYLPIADSSGNIAIDLATRTLNDSSGITILSVLSSGITVDGDVTVGNNDSLVLPNTAGDFSVSIKAPSALAASYTLTLPDDDGTVDQVLSTDGSGNLSWTDLPSGNPGEINDLSFSVANNQTTLANITGFAFNNATVRSFFAQVSVAIDATADLFELFEIHGIQKGASWEISVESTGDLSGILFDITSAGQMQYTSEDVAGFSAGVMKINATTTTI